MSSRRSISFDSDENDLEKIFLSNGRSKYAKMTMRFFEKYKHFETLVANGLGLNQVLAKSVSDEKRKSINKLIK